MQVSATTLGVIGLRAAALAGTLAGQTKLGTQLYQLADFVAAGLATDEHMKAVADKLAVRNANDADFEEVLCHDISARGVSFYCDDIQIGQSVVMCIGIGDDPMYVVAEVMHRRVVTQDDRLMYLAGCRFRRRLSQQTDAVLLSSYAERLALPTQREAIPT